MTVATGALPRELDGWIERLRLVPDAHRDYAIDLRRAQREFGVDEELARQLVDRGLPHSDGPRFADVDLPHADGPRFADVDLHYVGLRLGCATIYQGVLRRWASTLSASAARERTEVEIHCTPYAPADTDVEVLVARERRIRTRTVKRPGTISFQASIPTRWQAFDPELSELLLDLGALDFCWLPESLQGDVEWIRRTRLSNCAAAAHLLVEECARRGVEIRHAYGLLLAPPYSTPHYWSEIRTGGEWAPADPLLCGLLARHAGLDAAAWPPTRSPGAILLPLSEQPTAIVRSADGTSLEAAYRTKVLAGTAAP